MAIKVLPHHLVRNEERVRRFITEANPEVPEEIRRIIRRCLAQSPEQRCQSMKDLAIDLREAVEEWDTLSASATSAGSGVSAVSGALGVPAGRSTTLWAVAGAVALLGIGGLAFGLYSMLGREAAPASAGAGVQDLNLNVLMSRNDLGEAVLSADGRYLACSNLADQTTDLTVRQVRTGSNISIVSGNEDQIRGISFSPDSGYLFFLNRDPELPNDNALFQVASPGGTPRMVFFDVDTAAAFSPDGKRICWRRGLIDVGADSLVIGDLPTKEERELIRIEQPGHFQAAPAWSPDGERIGGAVAFTAPQGNRVFLWRMEADGSGRQQLNSQGAFTADAWQAPGAGIVFTQFEGGASPVGHIWRVEPEGWNLFRKELPDGGITPLTGFQEGQISDHTW